MQMKLRSRATIGIVATVAIATILIASPSGAMALRTFAGLTVNMIGAVLGANPFMALLWICLAMFCLIVLALLCLVWQASKYEPGEQWT